MSDSLQSLQSLPNRLDDVDRRLVEALAERQRLVTDESQTGFAAKSEPLAVATSLYRSYMDNLRR
jgi:hypothetical protein